MADEINFEVRNEEIEQLLKDIGHRIGDKMPPGWGFMLTMFTYGEGGSFFYISSAQRDDMIKVIDEWKEKLAGGTNG